MELATDGKIHEEGVGVCRLMNASFKLSSTRVLWEIEASVGLRGGEEVAREKLRGRKSLREEEKRLVRRNSLVRRKSLVRREILVQRKSLVEEKALWSKSLV
jgi:hypothetical protein